MIEKPIIKNIKDCEKDEALFYLTYLYRDLGYTDEMVANDLEISRKTLFNWRKKSQKIESAVVLGKASMDIKVENALLKQALQGNVNACIYWLRNRKPKVWNKDLKSNDIDSSTENILEGFFNKLEENIINGSE